MTQGWSIRTHQLGQLRPRGELVTIRAGRTTLTTDARGRISGSEQQGLWVWGARLLSRHMWRIDGWDLEPAGAAVVEQHRWAGFFLRSLGDAADPAPRALELAISRVVGDGMHEDVDLTNYTGATATVDLSLELDAQAVAPRDAQIDRRLRVEVMNAEVVPAIEGGRLLFRLSLAPRAAFHACVRYVACVEGVDLPLDDACVLTGVRGHRDVARAEYLARATSIDVGPSGALAANVGRVVAQAREDLAALRPYDVGLEGAAWVPAGGGPEDPVGQESLAAGWESSLLGPEILRGALLQLARRLRRTPDVRTYGGVTSALYYPFAAATLWRWTGSEAVVRPLAGPALRSLDWIDRHGDPDGDGLYEVGPTAAHQVAVRADGAEIVEEVGTAELQAFAYASKLAMSEVLFWLGDAADARRLFAEASALKRRFNDAFWIEEEGTFALALDARKSQVRSISGDAGQCLACGIVDDEHVDQVAARLMAPDLFSGWGIRTLSSEHPAFHPFADRRGAVWPGANAAIATGFGRYGLTSEMLALTRALFEVASLFEHFRLPSSFAGHRRDPVHPIPGLSPRADGAQAWATAAPFTLIQAMLGLAPYAPLHVLLLDPHLPDWLPRIAVRGLRVGTATVSLRFERTASGWTDYAIEDLAGLLHVVRQPLPETLTSGYGEQVRDAIASLLPGR